MVKLSDSGANANYPFQYKIGDRIRIAGGPTGAIVEGYLEENNGAYKITYDIPMDTGALTLEYEINLQKL